MSSTVDVLDDGNDSVAVCTSELRTDSVADVLGPAVEDGGEGLKRYCERT